MTSCDALLKEVGRYDGSMRALMNHCLGVGAAFENIFEPFLENMDAFQTRGLSNKLDAMRLEEASDSKFEAGSYSAIIRENKIAIFELLDIMKSATETNLKKALCILQNVQKNIKKRNYYLLDYDKYTENIEKLELGATALTPKQHQHLQFQKAKAEDQKVKYDSLNLTLKKELPYLFLLLREIVKITHSELYYAQLSIYDILSNSLKNHHLAGGITTSDGEETTSALKRNQAIALLECLSICQFRDNFLKNLTSNISVSPVSIQGEVERGLNNNESSVSYCKALYDYSPVEKGDLGFKKGDMIKVLQKSSSESTEWWVGESNGKTGVFPTTHVQMMY